MAPRVLMPRLASLLAFTVPTPYSTVVGAFRASGSPSTRGRGDAFRRPGLGSSSEVFFAGVLGGADFLAAGFCGGEGRPFLAASAGAAPVGGLISVSVLWRAPAGRLT